MSLSADIRLGLTSPSTGDHWLGGLYFAQHFVLCAWAAADPGFEARDVWWNEPPPIDLFGEIRSDLLGQQVVRMPKGLGNRLSRKIRRTLSRAGDDAGDLFRAAKVNVLFPVRPCAKPGVPVVLFLTDFRQRYLPQYFDSESWAAYESYGQRECDRADLIIVGSEAAADDMRRFWPRFVHKTRTVFLPAVPTEDWWRLDPDETAKRYDLPEKFFLVSNQLNRHKNHRTIFDATRLLRERGHRVNLVCTGKKADYWDAGHFPRLEDFVARHGMGSQIRFLGVIPREDQMAILRKSIGVLQPSEFEGWGAAVAEPAALGKPILASDLPVHREHAADDIAFLSALDTEAWAGQMLELWRSRAPGPQPEIETRASHAATARASLAGRNFLAALREAIAEKPVQVCASPTSTLSR